MSRSHHGQTSLRASHPSSFSLSGQLAKLRSSLHDRTSSYQRWLQGCVDTLKFATHMSPTCCTSWGLSDLWVDADEEKLGVWAGEGRRPLWWPGPVKCLTAVGSARSLQMYQMQEGEIQRWLCLEGLETLRRSQGKRRPREGLICLVYEAVNAYRADSSRCYTWRMLV